MSWEFHKLVPDHLRKSFILTIEVGDVVRLVVVVEEDVVVGLTVEVEELELVVVLVGIVVELGTVDELVVDAGVGLVLVEVSVEEALIEVVV